VSVSGLRTRRREGLVPPPGRPRRRSSGSRSASRAAPGRRRAWRAWPGPAVGSSGSTWPPAWGQARWASAPGAADLAGRVQPDEPEWNRRGYGANVIQEIRVLLRW